MLWRQCLRVLYSRVFGVGEFNANKNFKGAKRVAIATKFTQKGQKCTDFSSIRNIVLISTYTIGFRDCTVEFKYVIWIFQGAKSVARLYGNHQMAKNKPKLHKFHFFYKILRNFSREQYRVYSQRIHILSEFLRDQRVTMATELKQTSAKIALISVLCKKSRYFNCE